MHSSEFYNFLWNNVFLSTRFSNHIAISNSSNAENDGVINNLLVHLKHKRVTFFWNFYTLSHCTLTQTICYRVEHFLWYHLKFPFIQRETICTYFTAKDLYYTILLTGIRNWPDLKGYTHFNEKCNWTNIPGYRKYNPVTDS